MISIIIPVYNAQKYLSRCIKSLRDQTYQQFEVILINDGSTDITGQLCDKYQLEDNRFRAIHTENYGPASARNTGINNAKG